MATIHVEFNDVCITCYTDDTGVVYSTLPVYRPFLGRTDEELEALANKKGWGFHHVIDIDTYEELESSDNSPPDYLGEEEQDTEFMLEYNQELNFND